MVGFVVVIAMLVVPTALAVALGWLVWRVSGRWPLGVRIGTVVVGEILGGFALLWVAATAFSIWLNVLIP